MNLNELGITRGKEYVFPKRIKGLLHEASLLPTGVFKRVHDERGSSDPSLVWYWLAGVVVAIPLSIAILTSGSGQTQDQKIAALQTQVAALTTPVAARTPIVEISEPDTSPLWHQKEKFRIQLSDSFRPSMVHLDLLHESRRAENLVGWENIVEINDVPVTGAQMLEVNGPVTVYERVEKLSTGNAILDSLRSGPDKYTYYDLTQLRAIVRGNSGQLEKRHIYVPLDTPESGPFVQRLSKPGKLVSVQEKDGRYYPAHWIWEQVPQIPRSEIGAVTVIPQ